MAFIPSPTSARGRTRALACHVRRVLLHCECPSHPCTGAHVHAATLVHTRCIRWKRWLALHARPARRLSGSSRVRRDTASLVWDAQYVASRASGLRCAQQTPISTTRLCCLHCHPAASCMQSRSRACQLRPRLRTRTTVQTRTRRRTSLAHTCSCASVCVCGSTVAHPRCSRHGRRYTRVHGRLSTCLDGSGAPPSPSTLWPRTPHSAPRFSYCSSEQRHPNAVMDTDMWGTRVAAPQIGALRGVALPTIVTCGSPPATRARGCV